MSAEPEAGDESVAYFKAYPSGTPHGFVAIALLSWWALLVGSAVAGVYNLGVSLGVF